MAAGRERLRRIGIVRHLREVREKQEAKAVAAGVAAVEEAERLIRMLAEEGERLREELSSRMAEGLPVEDVTMGHHAWLDIRAKRTRVMEELERRRVRLAEANIAYRAARIARRQMEKWEDRVAESVRLEEARIENAAVDEITVVRHGWRRG